MIKIWSFTKDLWNAFWALVFALSDQFNLWYVGGAMFLGAVVGIVLWKQGAFRSGAK